MRHGNTSPDPPVDTATLRQQRDHWGRTFAAHPDMYGTEPRPRRTRLPTCSGPRAS